MGKRRKMSLTSMATKRKAPMVMTRSRNLRPRENWCSSTFLIEVAVESSDRLNSFITLPALTTATL